MDAFTFDLRLSVCLSVCLDRQTDSLSVQTNADAKNVNKSLICTFSEVFLGPYPPPLTSIN